MYHLDYPSIGYHNMKEHEYMDPAVHYYNEGLFTDSNFLHRRSFMFDGLDEGTQYHEEYMQVPIISYTTFFAWKIFGKEFVIIQTQGLDSRRKTLQSDNQGVPQYHYQNGPYIESFR